MVDIIYMYELLLVVDLIYMYELLLVVDLIYMYELDQKAIDNFANPANFSQTLQ